MRVSAKRQSQVFLTCCMVALCFSSFHRVYAQSTRCDKPQFEITTEIVNLTDTPVVDEPAFQRLFEFAPLALGIDPMAITDIAFKVWDIVVANKPVVNVDSKSASALPVLADGDWRRLTGWKRQRSVTFKVVATTKTPFGKNTNGLEYTYTLSMIYGGGVAGKGQFISSARIQPNVLAKWGYNLDVAVTVPSIVNMGSEEDPLAAIYLNMTYNIHTIVKSDSHTESYLFQGDGLMMNANTNETYFEGDARGLVSPVLN